MSLSGLLLLVSAARAAGDCPPASLDGRRLPFNAQLFVTGEAAQVVRGLPPELVSLTDGYAHLQFTWEEADPPGALSYVRVVLTHPVDRWGRYFVRSEFDRPVVPWEDPRGGLDLGAEADHDAPRFAGVRRLSPGWWPASRGVALLVTLTEVWDPSLAFLDVYLTRVRTHQRGRPLSHNVDEATLATPGEWWDRLVVPPFAGENRLVELFGGRCGRGLPAGTRVGDTFEVTLRLVDVAGNESEARSFELVVPG